MSRSSTSSVERYRSEEVDYMPAAGAGSSPPVPLPTLMSHPPLRLQRKPIPGTILKKLPGASPPLPTPLPSISPSQEPPPLHEPPQSSNREETAVEEALLPCPFCPAMFKKVGHLNRHTLKHTGTRFHCEVKGCDKTFSRLDNMRTQ